MGRMQTAQYLINVGCGIHDKDAELRTPLHRAVQVSLYGHVPIVSMLLRMGAKVEVNEGNEDNDMILMAKSSKGNVRATRAQSQTLGLLNATCRRMAGQEGACQTQAADLGD